MKNNILITGPPRCGKSTLIKRVVKGIERPVTGFFTPEIKEEARRVGFSIDTLDGRHGILAHEDIKGEVRVGRYGVNLKDIDSIAAQAMIPTTREEIVVIDEIGKMECFSQLFRETLIKVLDLPNCVIGSIAQKGALFIQGIKERDDVVVVGITTENRDPLVDEILGAIRSVFVAR